MLGKLLQGYLEGIPVPTTVHSSRGSPSLPATHTVKHALPENFALGGEKQKRAWPDKRFNNISLGLDILISCRMAIQDRPGLVLHHPLFLSPTHTLHPFRRYFSQGKPSLTGRSRQQSLPLLQLHLNYSLLSSRRHTSHLSWLPHN